LNTLKAAYTDRPTISVGNPNGSQGVFFTYPGVMVDLADGKVLFTTTIVPIEQLQYLENRGIQVVRINR